MFCLLHWSMVSSPLSSSCWLVLGRKKKKSSPPFIVHLAFGLWSVCVDVLLCFFFSSSFKGKNLSLRMWITSSIHQWLRCLRASTLASTKCAEEKSSSSSSPTSCRPWSLATPTTTGKNSKRYLHKDLVWLTLWRIMKQAKNKALVVISFRKIAKLAIFWDLVVKVCTTANKSTFLSPHPGF